ncbi:hypothetical protein BKA66DRAFT_442359 [Pyrenochaeta sp. MPI-SDFR-AT-0127]|nr:hypothetical protein BKA66DRAFT_442359 [Pyrenochaeta sp. MPI-SDFR-AT-0127]
MSQDPRFRFGSVTESLCGPSNPPPSSRPPHNTSLNCPYGLRNTFPSSNTETLGPEAVRYRVSRNTGRRLSREERPPQIQRREARSMSQTRGRSHSPARDEATNNDARYRERIPFIRDGRRRRSAVPLLLSESQHGDDTRSWEKTIRHSYYNESKRLRRGRSRSTSHLRDVPASCGHRRTWSRTRDTNHYSHSETFGHGDEASNGKGANLKCEIVSHEVFTHGHSFVAEHETGTGLDTKKELPNSVAPPVAHSYQNYKIKDQFDSNLEDIEHGHTGQPIALMTRRQDSEFYSAPRRQWDWQRKDNVIHRSQASHNQTDLPVSAKKFEQDLERSKSMFVCTQNHLTTSRTHSSAQRHMNQPSHHADLAPTTKQPHKSSAPPTAPPTAYNLREYDGRIIMEYKKRPRHKRFIHGNGKVGPAVYGSNQENDLGLCFSTFCTRFRCEMDLECPWRHHQLTGTERHWILAVYGERGRRFLDGVDKWWAYPEVPVPGSCMADKCQ